MSRIVFSALLYICVLAVPAYSQQNDVFGDSIVQTYEKAFELNESKDFLKAYRQIAQAERAVDQIMTEKKVNATELGDYEFWKIY